MMKLIAVECLLIVSPLFFIGLINKVKAAWAGRKGPPLLQPYYDFYKLLRKGEVISRTTSFVFKIAPSMDVAAVLLALLIVPLPILGSVVHFEGDFVLFAYALSLAKFLTVIAALDTGSSFEGMGASREVTYSTIVETAFFVIIGSLALLTHHVSFDTIFAAVGSTSGFTPLIKILLVVSLFIMLLAEGSRVPVDDPNTHLELTMIHEVMVLDYSGPDLAFIQYAGALKMTIIAILMADLLVPAYLVFLPAMTMFLLILALVFISVGAVESLIARSRISHIPQFLFLMTTLSLTAFAVVAFLLFGGIR
ncbi:MAG TPA: NADH-quinone oxidoreductase subunit H [Candidatus Kryptobacter bacterium]|nr:NADH-quinone oxidoreductase subunit H [Candidatus Kryptobacter bacterium]